MGNLEDIKDEYITPGTAGISMRAKEMKEKMYDLGIVKYHKVMTCGQNQH